MSGTAFEMLLYIMILTILFYVSDILRKKEINGFSIEIDIIQPRKTDKEIVFHIFYNNKILYSISRIIEKDIFFEFVEKKEHLIYINFQLKKEKLQYTVTINRENSQIFAENGKFILRDHWDNSAIFERNREIEN